jgi:hypothetical protein
MIRIFNDNLFHPAINANVIKKIIIKSPIIKNNFDDKDF